MQWLYKLFISEKEVVSNLPMIPQKRLKKEKINNFINNLRRTLFFRKIKNCLKRTINVYRS